MQHYASGDFTAFETLYQRHKGGLYRYFMRHFGQQNVAEDLYQEVWLKVIAAADNYRVSAKFSTWLYTLAHNKMVDHIRHLSVVDKVVVGDDKDMAQSDGSANTNIHNQPDTALDSQYISQSLRHCLSRLPQAQKDSFLLKEEAGLTAKDIASVLNTNYEASKSRLRYAYENLRQCLEIKLGEVF